MLSVLEQPGLRARISRLTLDEYHRLGERSAAGKGTELIRGIVIEKMSKSPLHGTIASLLQDLLIPQVPAGCVLRREEPLTLRDSEPEPDLALVSGTRADYLHAHPSTAHLVVEVAVTSPDDDRAMAELYAEAGVGEYWVVLPKERAIEVYRRPAGLSYQDCQRYESGDEVACSTVPGLRVSLPQLFHALG
jgi:Uma2 family endonuclease